MTAHSFVLGCTEPLAYRALIQFCCCRQVNSVILTGSASSKMFSVLNVPCFQGPWTSPSAQRPWPPKSSVAKRYHLSQTKDRKTQSPNSFLSGLDNLFCYLDLTMGFVQFPIWCRLILRVALCYSRSVIRISRRELGPVLRADGCGRYVGLLSGTILLFVVRPLHEKTLNIYTFSSSLSWHVCWILQYPFHRHSEVTIFWKSLLISYLKLKWLTIIKIFMW